MNISDMHIAINLGVQKIASFQVDTILIEEMDIEINKSIERFVNQRYNKFGNKYQVGFEETQKRIDDLRTLIREYSNTTTYKGQVTTVNHIDTFTLPDENIVDENGNTGNLIYRYLINARSLVLFDDCNPIDWEYVQAITGSLDELSITITSTGQDYNCPPSVVIDPPPSGGTPAQGVATLNGSGGVDLITITNTGTGYTGNANTTYNINLVNPLPNVQVAGCPVNVNDGTNTILVTPPICSLLSVGMGVNNNSAVAITPLGTFITAIDCVTVHTVGGAGNFKQITLSQNVTTMPSGQIELWDNFNFTEVPCIISNAMSVATGLPETITANTITIGLEMGSIDERTISNNAQTASSVNKYVQLDDIYTLLEDPFNGTKHTKPLMTIRDNNLDMYTDDTFVVRRVKITYIKKPAIVAHDNSAAATGPVNCDLPDHTHQEIVNMTVNSILEGISDPRYQTNTVELMKSE